MTHAALMLQDALAFETSAANRRAKLEAQIHKATRRVAPLWSLKYFVAVNPFFGVSDHRFEDACASMGRVAGAKMLMPRSYYREQIAKGRIADIDLQRAIEERGRRSAGAVSAGPATVEALRRAAQSPPALQPAPRVETVADVRDRLQGSSWASFCTDEISRWCAAYYDQGQANWRMPWRGEPLYQAWRSAARFDRNPEVMGLAGFRKAAAQLPGDPTDAIAAALERMCVPADAVDDYLHRAIVTINGWAAYIRFRVWEKELYGGSDDSLVHLLAIRIAWDHALFALADDSGFGGAWAFACAAMRTSRSADSDPDLVTDGLLQRALEVGYQRDLVTRLVANPSRSPQQANIARKAVQAAFCIDVRSEVYRRALETVTKEIDTIGFAGFFGFFIEYIPIGQEQGGIQCPVLLKPNARVRETVQGASRDEEQRILDLRRLRRRVRNAWKSFKTSAVSCFSFVETAGLLFAFKLIGDSFGLTRPVAHPTVDGLDDDILKRVGPELDSRPAADGGTTGFTPEQRIKSAEIVFNAMSLKDNFARIVLLCGHGSTTVNNPYASALDCGACGGHTGEANARIAADMFNDPSVRTGLKERGIFIPDDTWFIGGLHDTCTDEITLYNTDRVPPSHVKDLAQLREWLGKASHLTRMERSSLLGIRSGANIDAKVEERSRDWAQVRPEWALANNAAFIAAPRERTKDIDLCGRSFLHNYNWRQDTTWWVLELIMTAPMVVANWINLQYYGSTVDNRAFGSGNKVLHNVVGTIGVLQGNAGDLQTGLPWQSVHDGKRFVHEPLRLNVFIEAPEEQMTRIIEKHANVRELLDNRWLYLFGIADEGRTIRRYVGNLNWETERTSLTGC